MADGIIVVAEQRDGRLNRVSLETLAAAQAIGKDTGWLVDAVLPGYRLAKPAAELSRHALRKIYTLEGPPLEPYTSDAYVHALRDFLSRKQPRLVLFPHTYQTRDFAPSLAMRMDCGLISDAISYRVEEGRLLFSRPMFRGKFVADVAFAGDPPWLATVQAGAYSVADAVSDSAPIETVEAPEPPERRITAHEIFRESKQTIDLSQAHVIIAVGRGIKEEKNIRLAEELAEALGGEVAASRPICDNGWLPLDRQIGSSGQTVAPELYLALGISGAIQHLVGMKGSRTVFAINKDPEAPIFEIADYGVVGDLFEIVPALVEEIRKIKAAI